ncbi:MAG: hypothetical protein Q8O87_01010 [bacterium]|nr:hypothetical protein [bacterium]
MPAVIVPGSVSYEGETFRPTTLGGAVEFMVNAFNIDTADGTLSFQFRQRFGEQY